MFTSPGQTPPGQTAPCQTDPPPWADTPLPGRYPPPPRQVDGKHPTGMHSRFGFKACLHVPSLSPCLSPSPSKFNILPMVTVCLMGRMGTEPILSVKRSVSIDTMINFDGDGDGHGDRDGTCIQAFSSSRYRQCHMGQTYQKCHI